ncbi:MAG: heme lyase CcmF/NrfE family subunit [Calditrichaceae bacterium]|nr:cytochrome c biogenesis protein CcsA [Calditrichia bacterium]NUQ40711.1 heme lyase CcmF/NrfE family subunit [Calditrichaceae bacterium]
MDIGNLLIILALLATLFSGGSYFSAVLSGKKAGAKAKKGSDPSGMLWAARLGFYLMAGLVTLASAYLMYLILTHQFQVSYVYRYSSRDLPLGYLLSSFWAGQEGSFLLWAFLIALMGIAFIKTAKEFEISGMLAVNLVQAFFLAILVKASPFETYPQVPADGAGLNPLLQNPWMVIHPPVLFIGYAAITFLFALAFAGLLRRDYKQWVSKALPWALFVSLTLGAGIIIGAYWAYEVLGWGGYWGWDPVENSSLVPWLTTLALLHGLIVQKRTGALPKTNFFLAIVSLVLVLYATFLTRSGVLADFSVHSFQDLGINRYLILFMAATLGLGLGAFFWRGRDIPHAGVNYTALNRENILLASLFVFAASALLVFFGTSSPIITGLLGNASAATVSYYNTTHLPIGILIAVLLSAAPFLRWREEGFAALWRNLLPSLLLSAATTAIPVWSGMSQPTLIIFVFFAAAAFWSNLIAAIRYLKINWLNASAPIAHVGVGLLLMGIVISAVFEQNQKVVLEKDVPGEALNYRLIYRGLTPAANGKDVLNIDVSRDQTAYTARPRFYFSRSNQGQMREPDVRSNLMYDLYISPLERRSTAGHTHHGNTLVLKKGEKKSFGDYQVSFVSFDMGGHSEAGVLRVGANLTISNERESYSVVPAVLYSQGGARPEAATFPLRSGDKSTSATVTIQRIDADQKLVELELTGLGEQTGENVAPKEMIMVEVSRKPFMSVLWLGAILMTAGTLIGIRRRLAPAGEGQ